jgi:ubiquinone/menaquinone biosynthesis C-methylase UbiE
MRESQPTDRNLQFREDHLAALYDLFFTPVRQKDLAFCMLLVMSARAVLDVGCATGALLRRARETGHSGQLCGIDPAPGMLVVTIGAR